MPEKTLEPDEINQIYSDIDLEKVETGQFETVPEGWYNAYVFDSTVGKSANGAYIEWQFKIADGDYAGRFLWGYTSLLPQALFNLKGLCQAAGYEPKKGEFSHLELLGKVVRMQVRHESYNGEVRAKVKRYSKSDGEFAVMTVDKDDTPF